MKTVFKLFFIVALLPVLLFGCRNQEGANIEAYEVLLGEMNSLEEYRFFGDMRLNLEGSLLEAQANIFPAELMPMQLAVSGVASQRMQELQAQYTYASTQGEGFLELGVLLQGTSLYIELLPVLETMLVPILEEAGVNMRGLAMEDIIGPYTHLHIPGQDSWGGGFFAPMAINPAIDIGPFLQRDGEVFTLVMTGREVALIAQDIAMILAQFDGQGPGVNSAMGDVAEQLHRADLSLASASIITARTQTGFAQTIELRVPNLIELWANFTFEPWAVAPLIRPSGVLEEAELEQKLMNLDFNEIRGGAGSGGTQAPAFGQTQLEVHMNLPYLHLTGHLLPEGGPLSLAHLPSGHGTLRPVLVVAQGVNTPGVNYLTVDSDAIFMHYRTFDDLDAVEALLLPFAQGQTGHFLSDSTLYISPLRTNEDRSVAAMAIAERSASGLTRLYIYLAQVIDDHTASVGDVISLELVLYVNLFGRQDEAVLAELSSFIGLNLGQYGIDLLGIPW